MIGRIACGLVLGALVVVVTGCGERPQVIEYKQGKYQGKPDQPPWDGAKFNGNRNEWELAIKQRLGGLKEVVLAGLIVAAKRIPPHQLVSSSAICIEQALARCQEAV